MITPTAAIEQVEATRVEAGRDRPLVSVIVPVYNGERYLAQSLDSILGQTYEHLEVIVVDDASSDATPDILAVYGDRIRVHRQAETRGIYGNANDGIALACGDLIGVFHADDIYLPQLIEQEVAWLERYPEAGAVFCSDIFVDADGREFGRLELPPEIRGEQPLDYATVLNALLKRGNVFLRCPTALVRAAVYRDVGGYRDDEFKNSSDIEMWVRIARHYPIGILERHLLLYRRGHGSSAERYHRLRTDPFRFFRILDLELAGGGREVADADALRAFEAHRAVDLTMCAVSHYILGNRDDARRVVRSIRLRNVVGSRHVQRWRMLALLLALRGLVCVPHLAPVARAFERHWHGVPTPAGAR